MNSLSAQLEMSGSWRVVTTADKDLQLMLPEADVDDPEVSIVIPALNEAITIGLFMDWCQEGLRRAGVRGEILIIDSSTDATAEIALAKGARVLKSPKRGLGRAYIDALPFIRGKYVIMGDADCTYDFRQIEPFIESFRSGHEYVMGSRFKGFIEPGAMPTLHRYFGTPITTWMLNFLYGSHFSDIHCGMRGITLAALRRMDLHSQSWEYASEMVLKSVRMNLRIDRGARPIPQGPGRSIQPPQTIGVVFALARRLDQRQGDVHLRRRLLPVPAGPAAAVRRPAADAAHGSGAEDAWARSPSL